MFDRSQILDRKSQFSRIRTVKYACHGLYKQAVINALLSLLTTVPKLGEGSLKVVFLSNEGFFLESTTFIQVRTKTFKYRKFKNVMIYCLQLRVFILLQEFQEVLTELAKDKSMDAFRGEYEKLFNTLEKSNKNEKRLRTKAEHP